MYIYVCILIVHHLINIQNLNYIKQKNCIHLLTIINVDLTFSDYHILFRSFIRVWWHIEVGIRLNKIKKMGF